MATETIHCPSLLPSHKRPQAETFSAAETPVEKRKKLEEQHDTEKSWHDFYRDRHETILALLEQSRQENAAIRQKLRNRYFSKDTVKRPIPRKTLEENIKAEVQRMKRSLVRFVDTKIAQLFEDPKEEAEWNPTETCDTAVQTDLVAGDDSGKMEAKESPVKLFEGVKTLADDPNNPFTNMKILPPLKPLFGTQEETKKLF